MEIKKYVFENRRCISKNIKKIKVCGPPLQISFLDNLDNSSVEIMELPKNDYHIKYGSIFQLGEHRIMCGDSTLRKDLMLLLGAETPDMVFADPPYGMGKEREGVQNDNLHGQKLIEFNKKWFDNILEAIKYKGAIYLWGFDLTLFEIYCEILRPLLKLGEIVIRNYITWAKHSAKGINSQTLTGFPCETEKCFFMYKRFRKRLSTESHPALETIVQYLSQEKIKAKLTTKIMQDITGVTSCWHWFSHTQFALIPEKYYQLLRNHCRGLFSKSYEELKKSYKSYKEFTKSYKELSKPYFNSIASKHIGGIGLTDVWRFSSATFKEREEANRHPTIKPISLCKRAIEASTKKHENVLDVFGGSGSILLACEQLKRKAFVMELNPKWVSTIINRWEIITHKKAIKIR